jgi:hypothetical protein
MKCTDIFPTLFAASSLAVSFQAYAAPVSVTGSSFTLVATNSTDIELYGLAEDDQGNIYAGNNSNGSGIPLQLFQPNDYTNRPIPFQNFGPICDDGDGLAYGNGFLYVASLEGVQQISVTNGIGTLFLPGVAANITGSPLVFRASDRHLFVGLGYGNGPGITEYDSTGALVTNHVTTAEVETMTFDPQNGMIYYAPFNSEVHSFNPNNDTDALIATINGTIDGALTVDDLSDRIFVGTANGSNQGSVYTIDPSSYAVAPFATGFQGSLGVLRGQLSGQLYFLDDQNLYRLDSASVSNALAPVLTINTAISLSWASDTNHSYQVQWQNALNTNIWTNLGLPVQGNGTTNFVFDVPITSPQRFYRLVVLP